MSLHGRPFTRDVREIEAGDADLLSALALLFQRQVCSEQSAPCNPDFLEASECGGGSTHQRLRSNLLAQRTKYGSRHGSRQEPSSIHAYSCL
jgi:hypothetical protein